MGTPLERYRAASFLFFSVSAMVASREYESRAARRAQLDVAGAPTVFIYIFGLSVVPEQ